MEKLNSTASSFSTSVSVRYVGQDKGTGIETYELE